MREQSIRMRFVKFSLLMALLLMVGATIGLLAQDGPVLEVSPDELTFEV